MAHAAPADLANPAEVATSLGDSRVHLWWLPYARAQRRQPLRALLAAYLHVDPTEIRLRVGAHGRPFLMSSGEPELHFNWSHSGSHAVVAVARGLPTLGVDIECTTRHHRIHAIAERFFAPEEARQLRAVPPEQREAAFRRIWTAKEAVLKGHGQGLAFGLARVAFRLADEGIRPSCFQGDIGDAATWQVRQWMAPGGACCTLAWRGNNRQIRHFRTSRMLA